MESSASTWYYDVDGNKSIIYLLFAHSSRDSIQNTLVTTHRLVSRVLKSIGFFPHIYRHLRQVCCVSGVYQSAPVLRNQFDSCRSGKSIRKQINKVSLTGAVSLITWCVCRSSLHATLEQQLVYFATPFHRFMKWSNGLHFKWWLIIKQLWKFFRLHQVFPLSK